MDRRSFLKGCMALLPVPAFVKASSLWLPPEKPQIVIPMERWIIDWDHGHPRMSIGASPPFWTGHYRRDLGELKLDVRAQDIWLLPYGGRQFVTRGPSAPGQKMKGDQS